MNIAEELRTRADRIEGSHIPKDEKDLRIEIYSEFLINLHSIRRELEDRYLYGKCINRFIEDYKLRIVKLK